MNEQHYALASLGAIEYNPAPTTYRDAMRRKDKLQWTSSMHVEFDNMQDKDVWRIVKRADVPHGRKIIGNRWVSALKDDGTYRSRTVGKGLVRFLVKVFRRIMPL
jgi:hypothetical protein